MLSIGLRQVHLLDASWWTKSFLKTRSLRVANSGGLSPLSFVSSLQKGPQMPCQFPQTSLPTFALQSPCTTRMSFSGVWQCHSIAVHRILLFHCHHSSKLGRTLIFLWCWKRLPSGGWWWACWRLGDIPWQCSRRPCEQGILRHARVYPLFHWRKPCALPLLLFRQSSSISFYESKDVPSVPVHFVCVPCAQGDVASSTNLLWCTSNILDTSVLVYSGRRGPCWPGRRPIWYGMVVMISSW